MTADGETHRAIRTNARKRENDNCDCELKGKTETLSQKHYRARPGVNARWWRRMRRKKRRRKGKMKRRKKKKMMTKGRKRQILSRK